ncbi:MAG TPA: fumarylacetoacetate hydrolase family protein [Dehalococcoidia bacterium]|jgi:2-keto-4-pentenoate hydratase/2-oxohepta-3-ene-1,7-dioic acid hydratase in catechol pathway
MQFSLVTYASPTHPRAGVLMNDRVADAGAALGRLPAGANSMSAVLEQWDAALPLLAGLAEEVEAGTIEAWPLAKTRLLAPLQRPANLYCAFANYVDHMKEMGGTPADPATEDAFLFQVPVNAVIGPEEPIPAPPGVVRLDWEGELAAVIGRAARNLSPEQALRCVAGYTIVHDVSIRGAEARRGDNGGRPDWLAAKGRTGFKPMGPSIVPAQFVSDPQALALRTRVNGVTKQESSTAQMIYSTAQLVSHVSRLVGVVPGDVIATGTPAGVGLPRREFLKPGDVVEIEIEGLGVLRNPVGSGV